MRRLGPLRSSIVTGLACLGIVCAAGSVVAQTRDDSLWRERRRVLAAKPVIQEVVVTGQDVFSASDIRDQMHSKQTSDFDFLPLVAPRRLRRDSDRQDSLALHNWLRSQGYLDAGVELTYRFVDSASSAARIEVHVHEGVRTLIDSVEAVYPEEPARTEVERAASRLQAGAPLNPFLVKQVQYDIKTAYANTGYPYAQVEVDTTFAPDRRTVDLRLQCRKGPLVHFGSLRLPELKWTRPHAVQRELAFAPGDVYSRRRIIRSEENLYTSGLFDFVALEALPRAGTRDTTPDFEVRGVERKPIFINARTGGKQDLNHDLVWGTEVEVGDRNFTGTGRLLRASGLAEFIVISRWQELKYRFSTAFTEPWPLGLHVPTTLELAYEPGIQDALRPYRIERWEGLLSVLRRWSRKTRAWLVFKYEQVNISNLEPEIEEQFRADSGISVTRSMTLAQLRDARDAPLSPTRGSVTSAEVEYAGNFFGGDNDFVRVEGSWSRYARMGTSLNVIAHRLRFGYLEATGPDNRVPSQELFFLGGANTVRGFKENSIGPVDDDGDPVGGQLVVVGNLELRRPLVGRFWMSLFVDVGNLWDRPESFRWDEWRVGAGAGLQFLSPVGPIRLDYGRRVTRDLQAAPDRLHVSIGYAF